MSADLWGKGSARHWNRHLGQWPSFSGWRIGDRAYATINSGFILSSGLDSVVVVRHRELLESPVENALEKGLSRVQVFDCEIEIYGFHGVNITLKIEPAYHFFKLLLSFGSESQVVLCAIPL